MDITTLIARSEGKTLEFKRDLSRLKELATLGIVVELGTSPNDPQRRYLLAEERARYGR